MRGELIPVASVRWIDRRSRPLLQPRALLARLQRAGAGTGRGPAGAAARAGQLLRRSTPPTSTSSSWSGSPACSTRSTPGSTPAAPTGSPRASRSTRSGPGARARPRASTRCFGGVLRPALEEHGIRIVSLDSRQRGRSGGRSTHRFHEQVFPALTPLVIGLGRPFPYISNLSLSLGVLLRNPESGDEIIARVKVPKELLGRFLPIGDDGTPSSRWRR